MSITNYNIPAGSANRLYQTLHDYSLIECAWLLEGMDMHHCTVNYYGTDYDAYAVARKFGKGETAKTIGPLEFHIGAPPFPRLKASMLAFTIDCVLSYAACVHNGADIIDTIARRKGILTLKEQIKESRGL